MTTHHKRETKRNGYGRFTERCIITRILRNSNDLLERPLPRRYEVGLKRSLDELVCIKRERHDVEPLRIQLQFLA